MEDNANFPIPPANFEFLVESILMQAQMQLGLFKMGDESEDEDSEPNLPLARHSLDLLAMLQDKTRNNLTVEEGRLLDNGLTELRFRYVQVANEVKSGNRKDTEEPRVASASDDTSRIITPGDGPRIITADGGKGTKSS